MGFLRVKELFSIFRKGESKSELDSFVANLSLAMQKNRQKIALLQDGYSPTYFGDLLERSSYFSKSLAPYVKEGDIIGFLGEVSPVYISYLLAILKLGAVYMPVPLEVSPTNQKKMIDSAKPSLLLSFGQDLLLSSFQNTPSYSVTRELYIHRQFQRQDPLDSRALYVIFSSGSTGDPKGVVGTKEGLLNRLKWFQTAYPFEDGEVLCQKTSTAFVDHIAEIFQPLISGKPCVIIPPSVVKDVSLFCKTLSLYGVSRVTLVPTYLKVLLNLPEAEFQYFRSLKMIISSGEAISIKLASRISDKIPWARLLNIYGSSEVSADVTYFEWNKGLEENLEDRNEVPIGFPITGAQVEVLDSEGSPCQIGVVGEICVKGVPVALGYLHRIRQNGKTEYFSIVKTGDLGKVVSSSGCIEYIGRKDRRVKINGIQIDLSAFERSAEKLPGVDLCRFEMINGFLTMFWTQKGSAFPNFETLDFPVRPSKITLLEEFPTLPSGKIDIQSLRKHFSDSPTDETRLEGKITSFHNFITFFQQFLNQKTIDVTTNFFELGIDSLRVNELVLSLKRFFDIDLSVAQFFELATIKNLYTFLNEGRSPEKSFSENSFHGRSSVIIKRKQAHLLQKN